MVIVSQRSKVICWPRIFEVCHQTSWSVSMNSLSAIHFVSCAPPRVCCEWRRGKKGMCSIPRATWGALFRIYLHYSCQSALHWAKWAKWIFCSGANVIWKAGLCAVCGRLLRNGESGVWGARQQRSPLASVTPAYPSLHCSQNTNRQNINISKTSPDNSLSLFLTPLFLPSFQHFLFALCYFAISPWSLPVCLSSRENAIAAQREWSGRKSHWLLVLDLVDGKRANVIVQALVTVDTGPSEGSVI